MDRSLGVRGLRHVEISLRGHKTTDTFCLLWRLSVSAATSASVSSVCMQVNEPVLMCVGRILCAFCGGEGCVNKFL